MEAVAATDEARPLGGSLFARSSSHATRGGPAPSRRRPVLSADGTLGPGRIFTAPVPPPPWPLPAVARDDVEERETGAT